MNEKVNINPIYWTEIYSIELAPYKKNLARKCKSIIKWDKEVEYLMSDPITNEEKIKPLLAKIKYLHEDLTLSQNLLNAIEAMQFAFVTTTVNLYDAQKIRELKYYNQSLEMAIKYVNASKENIKVRRLNGSN